MPTIIIQTPEGLITSFKCSYDTYILDAAEDAGIDLPYSCRAGSCSSCVARLYSGAVDQEDATFLEELNGEWVLTCCAYPYTERVELKTHVEEEFDGVYKHNQAIEQEKREELQRRVLDTYSKLFKTGFTPTGVEAINNFTYRAEGAAVQIGNNLSVSANVWQVDSSYASKTNWGASYVELLFNGKVIDKQRFSIKEAYMIDPKYNHLGTADFNIPNGLRGKSVTVKTTLHPIHSSGTGFSGSPSSIKQVVKLK